MSFKGFLVDNKVEIFTGLGISAILTGVFMACKSTLKVNSVLEEHNKMREAIVNSDEIDEKKIKTDTFKLYGYTAARFAGLYILPAALIAGGIGSMFMATKISMDDNVKLAETNAALAAVAAGANNRLEKYRDRVIEKYGKEVDEQLMCPAGDYVEETTETDEEGKKKKVKKHTPIVNPDADLHPHRFFITRANPNWQEDDDMMRWTFSCTEDALNHDLDTRRADRRPTWVSVNDARKALAVSPRRDLQFDVWVKDNDRESDRKIILKYQKVMLPSADGGFEPAWQVDLIGAEQRYDEIF